LDRAFPIRHNQINQGESAKSTATEVSQQRLGKKQFTVCGLGHLILSLRSTPPALFVRQVSSALEASNAPRKSGSLLYR